MANVYDKELKAAIFAAIQDHGKQAKISKGDTTTVHQWGRYVRKDGHKIPDLARWMSDDVRFAVEPLLALAEVFRAYGVKVGTELMPSDYFVSIYINGTYQEITVPEGATADSSTSLQWVKKSLQGLSKGDRVAVLGWFLRLVGVSILVDEKKGLAN